MLPASPKARRLQRDLQQDERPKARHSQRDERRRSKKLVSDIDDFLFETESDEPEPKPGELIRKKVSRRALLKMGAVGAGAAAAGYLAGKVQAGPPSDEIVISRDFIQLRGLNADPAPLPQGGIWYRSDRAEFFGGIGDGGLAPIMFSAGVSTGGNTLGDTIVQPGQMVLEGGSNVTLSQLTAAQSKMTVRIIGQAAAAAGISAGTQSVGSGTVIFSNSNNVSFGMSNSSVVTATASFPPETPFGISAGTQSVSTGTLIFSNSNGLSFGMSGSSQVTGSYSVPVVSDAIQPVRSATGSGTDTSRFAADDHVHEGVFSVGVSTGGNTAGNTVVQAGQLILQGGNSITLSQITAAGKVATVIVSGPNVAGQTPFGISAGTQSVSTGTVVFSNSNGISFGMSGSSQVTASYTVPVVSNALQDVGTATGSGTNTSRFAADDHVHRGQIGWDVNGIASTFFGTQQLSAGAMMSIATGGGSTRGSAQLINLWSSATTASRVDSANAIGANASRLALEGHQHAGLWAIDVAGNTAGNTSSGAGSLQLAGGPNVTLSGSTAAGGMTLSVSIPNSAVVPVVSNAIQDVNTATNSGTDVTRFAADDHVHRGVVGLDVNGIASTFYGTAQLSAGALMSLATGGASTRGSIQFINLLSSATTVSSVATANAIGAMASRFALEGHQHGGIPTLSVVGNTAGNTTQGNMSLILAGGPNITLSGSTVAGAMTVSVSAAAGAAVPVVSNAIQDVNTATGSGTNTSRFAADDHVHRGVAGIDINGIASTFYGTAQLSAGAMISLATGGASTRGSIQVINLWSSATAGSDVTTATVVGANNSRVALEAHQHRGIRGLNVSGSTTVFFGDFTFNSGNMMSFATQGASTAGSLSIDNLWSSATTASRVDSANAIGAMASRVALEGHQHAGLWQMSVGGNTTGGNTSAGAGSFMLAGGPGVTLSGATAAGGETLTISAVPNVLMWDNMGLGASNTLTHQDGSMLVFPLAGDNANLFPGNMTVSTVMLDVSGTVSTGAAFTMSLSLGFFTLNNSTQLSRVFSASTSWGSNAGNAGFTSLFQGLRFITIHSSQFDVQPTFSRTDYWGALWMRSTSGSQTWTIQGQQFLNSAQRSGTMAAGNTGGTSLAWFPLMGVRSASFSTAMPGAIAQSDLNKAVAGANFIPRIHMEGTVSSF